MSALQYDRLQENSYPKYAINGNGTTCTEQRAHFDYKCLLGDDGGQYIFKKNVQTLKTEKYLGKSEQGISVCMRGIYSLI